MSVFRLAEDELVYQIHVLSCDDVAVVEKMGSTWSFLLSLKKQVSPGGLPIDETGNDLQLTSSPQCIVVVTRSDQRTLTVEYFIVDNISSVEEDGRSFGSYPPKKCPYFVAA